MGKTIAFAISTHGLGHLTRQIALAKTLLDIDPSLTIKFVCSEQHIEKFSSMIKFHPNIIAENIPLVPNVVMRDKYHVDVESTIDSYWKSIVYETQLRDDMEWGRILTDVDLLVNDIESVHNTLARRMGKIIVNISNFTWSDILQYLGAEDLARDYVEMEDMADYHIVLPFSSDCIGFRTESKKKSIGLLARDIDWKKIEQWKNEKFPEKYVFINDLGEEASHILAKLCAELNKMGFVPILSNKQSSFCLDDHYVSFDLDSDETHDLVALSDFVISKAGYGVVSEAFSGGSFLIHWGREGFGEDIGLSNAITSKRYGKAIQLHEYIDEEDKIIEEILSIINENQDHKLDPKANSNKEIANFLLNLL